MEKTSYDEKPVPKEVCPYCLTHELIGHKLGCDKPQHTPTPWDHLEPVGEGLHGVMSKHVNKGGNLYVAQCNRGEDAAFIVRAVNSHQELLECLRWTKGGTTEQGWKTWEIWRDKLLKAEGK